MCPSHLATLIHSSKSKMLIHMPLQMKRFLFRFKPCPILCTLIHCRYCSYLILILDLSSHSFVVKVFRFIGEGYAALHETMAAGVPHCLKAPTDIFEKGVINAGQWRPRSGNFMVIGVLHSSSVFELFRFFRTGRNQVHVISFLQ